MTVDIEITDIGSTAFDCPADLDVTFTAPSDWGEIVEYYAPALGLDFPAGAFGAGRWQLFTKIVFPANLPALFNSLKINIGLSLVGVIAGEFLVSKAGLGYLIVYGGQVFQLDLVMAGVVILALMAVALYGCITLAERAVLRRRGR